MRPDQFAAVLRLPVEDRLRLVEEIWNSILESTESPDVADVSQVDLDRRAAALDGVLDERMARLGRDPDAD